MMTNASTALQPSLHKSLWPKATLIFVALLLTWQSALDHHVQNKVDASLQRALIAFAMARTLNGVISVAQGTEVAIQPAGVGVTLSPGEILDPVNDLVEQFSTVMLLASASLALQKLLLVVSQWPPLAWLISIFALLWIGLSAGKKLRNLPAIWRNTAFRMLTVLLLLRLAIPVTALVGDWAFATFLQQPLQQSTQTLQDAQANMTAIAQSADKPIELEQSYLQRFGQWFDSAKDSVNLQKRLEALEASATLVTKTVIDMIVVFILQTVILPLLILWLLIAGVKWASREVWLTKT